MIFIKNKSEWKEWMSAVSSDASDEMPEPLEYPCFADTDVIHWCLQRIKANYYYQKDIELMFIQLKLGHEVSESLELTKKEREEADEQVNGEL